MPPCFRGNSHDSRKSLRRSSRKQRCHSRIGAQVSWRTPALARRMSGRWRSISRNRTRKIRRISLSHASVRARIRFCSRRRSRFASTVALRSQWAKHAYVSEIFPPLVTEKVEIVGDDAGLLVAMDKGHRQVSWRWAGESCCETPDGLVQRCTRFQW